MKNMFKAKKILYICLVLVVLLGLSFLILSSFKVRIYKSIILNCESIVCDGMVKGLILL
ncbi:MAG: hypothetical protein ACK5LV_04240 [Lachnospirales bacterium]